MTAVRLCFVCLGNICRSPTAAGVMSHHLQREALDGHVEVDSAGTAAYHVGEPPDERAQEEARRRGISLDGTARAFTAEDLDHFDLVLAMDRGNLDDLLALAATPEHREKIRLLREFDPASGAGAEVPDPYYGGDRGFSDVFDLVDAACRRLVGHLREEHGLR
ncbi:MAG: low molecular weight protein-tyrosine-phosphatase [Acidimicrobiia bacterium]|nr:low molecular weight protein-tyrosine-phosphatase [Acidimicrobiia bacterium]